MTAPVKGGTMAPLRPAVGGGANGSAGGDAAARRRVWLSSWERALALAAPARRKQRRPELPPGPDVRLAGAQPCFLPRAQESQRRDGGSAAPAGADRGEAREAVRWHAEWTREGVRIWLGSDAAARAQVGGIEGVVAEVRKHLERRGLCVSSIVCNGREVWPRTAEQPQDGTQVGSTSVRRDER